MNIYLVYLHLFIHRLLTYKDSFGDWRRLIISVKS